MAFPGLHCISFSELESNVDAIHTQIAGLVDSGLIHTFLIFTACDFHPKVYTYRSCHFYDLSLDVCKPYPICYIDKL